MVVNKEILHQEMYKDMKPAILEMKKKIIDLIIETESIYHSLGKTEEAEKVAKLYANEVPIRIKKILCAIPNPSRITKSDIKNLTKAECEMKRLERAYFLNEIGSIIDDVSSHIPYLKDVHKDIILDPEMMFSF